MNGFVHYRLTKDWALQEGFSAEDAERIARADIEIDRDFPGRKWRNKRYHFRWLGARRIARGWLEEAVERASPDFLGRALHCEQDAISHGHLGHLVHWPGIDLWERRSEGARNRIEAASRALLREYRERTARADEWSRRADEQGV